MSSTTIEVPTSAPSGTPLVWISTPSATVPIAVTDNVVNNKIVLPSPFALYVPFATDAGADVNVDILVRALGTTRTGSTGPYTGTMLMYSVHGPGPDYSPVTVTGSSQKMETGEILLIPFTDQLDESVQIAQFTSALNNIEVRLTGLASNTPSAIPASRSVAQETGVSTTRIPPPSYSSRPASSHPTRGTTTIRTSSSSTSTTLQVSSGISTGAIAGSIVAAFVAAGILGALVAVWCLRRRSFQHKSSSANSRNSADERSQSRKASHRHPQVAGTLTEMIG